jgi:ribosomal protein L7Ae-like RNA K-turn-binding protein
MIRSTKRQRLEHPTSWMDCESIEVVVNAPVVVGADSIETSKNHDDNSKHDRVLRIPAASIHLTELFFERFQVEILKRYRYSLSSQIRIFEEDDEDIIRTIKRDRSILQQRIKIGINSCTRVLEALLRQNENDTSIEGTKQTAMLLVLTTDIKPPTIQAHLPVLASQVSPPVPIMLLSGSSSSSEFGKLLGTKNVSAVVFLSQNRAEDDQATVREEETKQVHFAVDSFVDYVRRKI